MNKGRKKKNPVRGKMVESNAIELAKLIDELRSGETETEENKVKKQDGITSRRSRDKMLTREHKARKGLHLQQAIGDEEVELRRRRGWSWPALLHRPHLHEIWILDDLKGALLVRIGVGAVSLLGSSDHGRRKRRSEAWKRKLWGNQTAATAAEAKS